LSLVKGIFRTATFYFEKNSGKFARIARQAATNLIRGGFGK